MCTADAGAGGDLFEGVKSTAKIKQNKGGRGDEKGWFTGAGCLLALGCFGCQNQQDALYSAAKEEGPSSSLAELASPPPSPEEEELTGELTIRHVAGGDNLQYFAKLFQQLHPEVEVTMVPTYSSQTEWSQSPDTHVPQLSTELMGGEAYDVVDVSMLETYRFAKSGLLRTCSPGWSRTPP